MSSHTPGPWVRETQKWGRGHKVSVMSHFGTVAVLPSHVSGPYGAESLARREADAKLMAAALDMLSALYSIVSAPGYVDLPEIDRERVRAAIAKATT